MKSWIAPFAGIALALGLSLASAQTFPSKAVKILVGVTPGGTTDTLARFLAQEMAKELGQAVVAENRAGAGGTIAAEAVAKSLADPYTLRFVNASHSVNMGLYGDKVPYDAVKAAGAKPG